jgi:hypothetical protein
LAEFSLSPAPLASESAVPLSIALLPDPTTLTPVADGLAPSGDAEVEGRLPCNESVAASGTVTPDGVRKESEVVGGDAAGLKTIKEEYDLRCQFYLPSVGGTYEEATSTTVADSGWFGIFVGKGFEDTTVARARSVHSVILYII